MTRKLVDVDWRFAPDFMRVSRRRKDDRICYRAVPPSRDSSSVFHHEAIAAFLGFRGKTVCGRIRRSPWVAARGRCRLELGLIESTERASATKKNLAFLQVRDLFYRNV